jgi:hypothetical protein
LSTTSSHNSQMLALWCLAKWNLMPALYLGQPVIRTLTISYWLAPRKHNLSYILFGSQGFSLMPHVCSYFYENICFLFCHTIFYI